MGSSSHLLLSLSILVFFFLTVSSAVPPDPHAYATDYEAHQASERAKEQRDADSQLDFFFDNHLVCPHGDTLISYANLEVVREQSQHERFFTSDHTPPIELDSQRLQRLRDAVHRRAARGWNISLIQVNVSGRCHYGTAQLCVAHSAHNASADCVMGVYESNNDGELRAETQGLVYRCETHHLGWGMIPNPSCHPSSRYRVITVVRVTLDTVIDIDIDSPQRDYQRQCNEVREKKAKAELERQQAHSDTFLARFFEERHVEPGRRDTYISLHGCDAPLSCVEVSVEALRERGWNMAVVQIRRSVDDNLPHNASFLSRDTNNNNQIVHRLLPEWGDVGAVHVIQ